MNCKGREEEPPRGRVRIRGEGRYEQEEEEEEEPERGVCMCVCRMNAGQQLLLWSVHMINEPRPPNNTS